VVSTPLGVWANGVLDPLQPSALPPKVSLVTACRSPVEQVLLRRKCVDYELLGDDIVPPSGE
jgi:hypothetical protein